MKKIKKLIYPFIHIVLPFIIVIVIAVKCSSILELIDYSTKGLKFNFSKLPLKYPRVIFSILLIVIQWFVIRYSCRLVNVIFPDTYYVKVTSQSMILSTATNVV